MKKILVATVFVLCLAAFAGCAKDKSGKQNPDGMSAAESVLVSEDYRQGNASGLIDGYFMRTDNGYYYYSESQKGFRYYDITTGKDMFLCNKPECKHDGNAFCVATNANYTVLNACLYSNRMYVYVMDETDTQYRLKVLSLALDGSELSEAGTVLNLEKTGQELVFEGENFCVHRNKVMIVLNIKGKDKQKDSELYGTAILDLSTGDVTYLDEMQVDKENPETKEVHAYGDYFYYYQRVAKKNVLHRYNIVTGTDETHNFRPGFSGRYAVLDDNTIAYQKTDCSAICFYYYDTGETVECTDFVYGTFDVDRNGEIQTEEIEAIPEYMTGDGEYVYAVDRSTTHSDGKKECGVEIEWRESIVIVYGKDEKKIATVNIAPGIDDVVPEGVNLNYWSYSSGLRFLSEDIYVEIPEEENFERIHVFKCKRSDFLAGEPKFEYVFVKE